jgi:hypothetical protein
MAKNWVYKYGDDTIKVVTTLLSSSELYVNGELRDKNNGFSFNERLNATLKSGETVSATIGGFATSECSLFVNEVLQKPVEVK